MNYTIGDGIVALALAGGIVGCLYVTHRTRQKRIEIIHQERIAAMEKGIPSPEFRWSRRRNIIRPVPMFCRSWERFF
jgi:hypothetical protein